MVREQEEIHFSSGEIHFYPEEIVISQELKCFSPEEMVKEQEEIHFYSGEIHFYPEGNLDLLKDGGIRLPGLHPSPASQVSPG